MENIDVSIARQRDDLTDLSADIFLPYDINRLLSPEGQEIVMQFALGWGAMAAEATRMESISPSDSRYKDIETQLYLSEQTRVRYQAVVESALVDTLADLGVCPREEADEIMEACTE